MIKLSQFLKQSLSLITLPLILLVNIGSAQSQLPSPPKNGTPKGNSTPGITRPNATCPKTDKDLTALIANNNSDYTRSEHPTLWFYIPYGNSQISSLEFVLLDESEHQTIYRTGVKLEDKPGIIKVTIPSDSKYTLEPDKSYRWYLLLDCTSKQNEPALVVDGWIKRIIDNSYPKTEIWYDQINEVAQQHFIDPNNQQTKQVWTNLLKSLGYDWVIQEPLVKANLTPPVH